MVSDASCRLLVCSDFLWMTRPPPPLFFFVLFFAEIERIQKGETKKEPEKETYLDLFATKNLKLKERVLIPTKQYPKVSMSRWIYTVILTSRRIQVFLFNDGNTCRQSLLLAVLLKWENAFLKCS